jgi:hypothetical protein
MQDLLGTCGTWRVYWGVAGYGRYTGDLLEMRDILGFAGDANTLIP